MLRTPPHPGEQADRTERLLAAVRVALVAALTALVQAADLADEYDADPDAFNQREQADRDPDC